MSRIFKKLNVESESTPVQSAPDLKLVPPLPEETPPSGSKSRLKKMAVFGVVSLVLLIGAGKLFQNGVPNFSDFLKPVTSAITSVGGGAAADVKLEADEQLNHDAAELYRTKDYAKALEKFNQLLQKHPDDPAIMNNVGMAYLKLNDYQKAETQFREVLKLEPKDSAAYSNLGSLKLAQMNSEEAISFFYQAILYHPEMMEPHLNLGKAFELAGRPMEAIPEYQYFLKNAPSNADPELKKTIEKRIAKLNSFSRYIEHSEHE